MSIQIKIPEGPERVLRQAWDDVERAALEALVIESYRTARITLGEVAEAMGLATSWEAMNWLGSRGVELNYSREDLEEDRRTIEELRRSDAA